MTMFHCALCGRGFADLGSDFSSHKCPGPAAGAPRLLIGAFAVDEPSSFVTAPLSGHDPATIVTASVSMGTHGAPPVHLVDPTWLHELIEEQRRAIDTLRATVATLTRERDEARGVLGKAGRS